MSKTYRYKAGKRQESRDHAVSHRFDGHKMARQVGHNYVERAFRSPSIERSGMRGK